MVSKSYKVGDRVTYHAVGGGSAGTNNSTTTGEIIEIITERQPVGETGNTVNASEEEPRYLIKNDNTQKETAYKLDNIMGLADEE
ncbi:hypothetical protein M422DRAFT_274952 [Sphaerobolus stellatus SS14]|uniref:Hypervirulence associated protein TUDOR domain-containing protein n=1 Tax=Sphaerobolus stellatus (strain SS14) TaxID=990650 RepID=A0A0C9UGH3_SPHS4|nr:hypothetical protein M422DRAFT_274952 [Sphaerobolus stellatus SS14]